MTLQYRVDITPPAVRQLYRLPPAVSAAVLEFLTSTLAANPRRLSKPLVDEFDGLRSSRRGEYRILFQVDEATQVVSVVRIAHRRDAYRTPAP